MCLITCENEIIKKRIEIIRYLLEWIVSILKIKKKLTKPSPLIYKIFDLEICVIITLCLLEII